MTYLGNLPEEEGGPDQSRAPGPGAPSPSQAVQLGIDYAELRATVQEVRSEVSELRQHLDTVLAQRSQSDDDLADLRSGMTELSESLQEINAALESEDSQEAESSAPEEPAAGWVHVAPEERQEWLRHLQLWVRDVLFVQWPHLENRLKWCWPLHMDIVSDLAILQRGYIAGFEAQERRFGDAEQWRRSLDYLMKQAEAHTTNCPTDPGAHPLPSQVGRDDSTAVSLVTVIPVVAQLVEHMQKAHAHDAAAEHPDISAQLRAQHEHEADESRLRAHEIAREGGLSQEQWALVKVIQPNVS